MLLNHLGIAVDEWNSAQESLCPECREPLIAKRGNIVIWHWAHKAKSSCGYGTGETNWHMAMKLAYRALGWEIEYGYRIGEKKFRFDAYDPETKRVREFVHTISDTYVDKHRTLVESGEFSSVRWILDGQKFAEGLKQHDSQVLFGKVERVYFTYFPERMHVVLNCSHCLNRDSGEWIPYRKSVSVERSIRLADKNMYALRNNGWLICEWKMFHECISHPRSCVIGPNFYYGLTAATIEEYYGYESAVLTRRALALADELGYNNCGIHVPRGFFSHDGSRWCLKHGQNYRDLASAWSGIMAKLEKRHGNLLFGVPSGFTGGVR